MSTSKCWSSITAVVGYDLGCAKFSTTQIIQLYIHRESIVVYISVAQNDGHLNLARYFSSRYFLESGKFSIQEFTHVARGRTVPVFDSGIIPWGAKITSPLAP